MGWDLIRRYAGPERHYHNLTHLAECLDALEDAKADCEDSIAVATAVWFHDAVYDAEQSDNEKRSKDLAVERLTELGETPERIARVGRLILDTAHRTEPSTSDGGLIADIDLAVLGKSPDRFDNYDAAIRLEYAHVPDDAFRRGRADVLRRFLDRPTIYRTRAFAALEQPARANLTRAITRLAYGLAGPGWLGARQRRPSIVSPPVEPRSCHVPASVRPASVRCPCCRRP